MKKLSKLLAGIGIAAAPALFPQPAAAWWGPPPGYQPAWAQPLPPGYERAWTQPVGPYGVERTYEYGYGPMGPSRAYLRGLHRHYVLRGGPPPAWGMPPASPVPAAPEAGAR